MANEFPLTEKYIRTYGAQVEQEIETRLHSNGKYASGELYDSIGYKVERTANRFSLKFVMADYGKYVDKGTKPSKYATATGRGSGKSAFITSLKKWCKIKGLPEGMAFPIRRKIWKFGLPATNFFTIPTTRRRKQFAENIKKHMIQDAENSLQSVKKELKKAHKRNGN
jgi:hypothetical protein